MIAKFAKRGRSGRLFSSSVASSFETPRKGAAPQDEVLDPHGEERGKAARLEPRGHEMLELDSIRVESAQRSGFFSSEKRSGSRPIEGCSIGASTVRAAGRSLMVGSLGTSRCEVAPRQRSSTALTKCMSWPAATDGTVEMVASLRGN